MKDVYTLEDLRHWDAATAGEEPPIRLAVFGDPVAHSRSPQMHNAALAACGIAARYCRLHIRPEELAEALRLLPKAGFIGSNFTIPHKAATLPLLDAVDDHARKIGVVNTVVVEGERLLGFNTDGPGLLRAIRAEFGVDLRDLRVMVLGAGGGAGRAIAPWRTANGSCW
jgi:shikimate dehydrogenase